MESIQDKYSGTSKQASEASRNRQASFLLEVFLCFVLCDVTKQKRKREEKLVVVGKVTEGGDNTKRITERGRYKV